MVLITERLGNSIGRPRNKRPSAAEPILTAIAAIGVFVWPFANRETPHAVTLLCLALAVLVEAAWAIHRYAPLAPRVREPLMARVRNGVRFGLRYAVFLGLVATALSVLRGGGDDFSLPAVLAAYLIGGVFTGIVVGLGRRLNQWPMGAMLLGVLGAFPAFLVISLLIPLMRADAPTLSGNERLGLSLAVSVLLGPIAGLILRGQWTDVK
ncbi:MAG: hypothetical protein ACJ796_01010 [Gemmatimonadaceae bacterium]